MFSLERTCSRHLGQTKSCGRTSQKKLRFTHRKFLFILTAKRKIKNCLDIISDHSLDFVQGHEQILAYVDERLSFTAVITGIVNWLALVSFLNLHLCICDAFKLTSCQVHSIHTLGVSTCTMQLANFSWLKKFAKSSMQLLQELYNTLTVCSVCVIYCRF